MFQLVGCEVKDLTPELAKQFRAMTPSPTERELNLLRVRHLKEKAEAGQLVTFQWSVAKHGSETFRMNGQHSSHMLCELDGKFPAGLKAHIDTYEVAERHDLALLFQQFDDRKSGRSTGDVSGAYQMLNEPLRHVPRAAAKLAVDGIAWWMRSVEGSPVPSGDMVYSLHSKALYHPFIRWVGELFSIKTPELKRAQVMSAMFATFTANETEARKFWAEVARGGDEYEDNAPATVLDRWLEALKEEKNSRNAKKIKPGEFYQGGVFAWNAYREGKSIKDIKYDITKGWYPVVS